MAPRAERPLDAASQRVTVHPVLVPHVSSGTRFHDSRQLCAAGRCCGLCRLRQYVDNQFKSRSGAAEFADEPDSANSDAHANSNPNSATARD